MKKEVNRMQKLAGIKNVPLELTNEEKVYLENEVEKFLNTSLFSSDILTRDNGDSEISLEEKAIQFIIQTLKDRISYY